MHICWVGGGSLGLLFAAKFALAKLPTHLAVHRKEQLHKIEQEGLKLVDGHQQLTASLACLTTDEEWTGAPPDWFALMVKQTQLTTSLLERLALWMERFPHAKLLCFQNGIGHEERLAQYIPRERLFMAVTTEAGRRKADNEVIHTGKGEIWIGNLLPTIVLPEKEVKNLIDSFKIAGFKAYVSKDIRDKVWTKLLINAVINPLTALLRVRNGQLIIAAPWVSVMRALFQEAKEVAYAEGGVIADSLWDELLEVCHKTALNHSSMLQDISNGRETEIESINGRIVQLAARHGLQAPINEMVAQMIRGLTQTNSFSDRR